MKNEQHSSTNSIEVGISKIKRWITTGNFTRAIQACINYLAANPNSLPFTILLSQAYQQSYQFDLMLACIQKLVRYNPDDLVVRFRLIECLVYCGQVQQAISELDNIDSSNLSDHRSLSKLAELYLNCAQHKKAIKCYQQLVNLSPGNPQYLYNLASTIAFIGEFKQSEKLFNKVISLSPRDFDAYHGRSGVRKQAIQNNHIDSLKQCLFQYANDPKAEVFLNYALGKEFDDIDDYSKAYKSLQKGAEKRRAQLSYQVSVDVTAMKKISQVFSKQAIENSTPSTATEAPIFIVGLPRSGTTLVDRIISSHSKVNSLGEINDFAYSLMSSVGENNGKLNLIEKSVQIDFNILSQKYANATKGYGKVAPYLIDKTPLNFLYLGLIKLAFPKSKVIHIKRHPLDSCFAMYKTLFRTGYPFSYDMNDLGEYYIAYYQLMAHWKSVNKNSFMDVEYNELVEDPEGESRKLLDYCDLSWEPSVIDFHKNTTSTATASAVQVRQLIYKTSVNRWKNYAEQLHPLALRLTRSGINCD